MRGNCRYTGLAALLLPLLILVGAGCAQRSTSSSRIIRPASAKEVVTQVNDNKYLNTAFFPVGNGQSSLIQFSKHDYMMYDCGVGAKFPGASAATFLKTQVDDAITAGGGDANSGDISLVILSHPHADHCVQFPNIFGNKVKGKYTPTAIYCGGSEDDWKNGAPTVSSVYKYIKQQGLDVTFILDDPKNPDYTELSRDVRPIDGSEWQVYIIGNLKSSDTNSLSLITLVTNNNGCELLLNGDATITSQKNADGFIKTMSAAHQITVKKPYELFQVAHHGSDKNTSAPLMGSIGNVDAAVISCDNIPSADNYNIPRLSVYTILTNSVTKQTVWGGPWDSIAKITTSNPMTFWNSDDKTQVGFAKGPLKYNIFTTQFGAVSLQLNH